MKLSDALELAHQIKSKECSEKTMIDYRSYMRNFYRYLVYAEKEEVLLADWGRRECMHYLDYLLVVKEHEAITRNNNLRAMKVLFNVLHQREYIADNPFVGIKFLKVKEKRRKVFTKVEMQIIINYLKANDKELLLAVSLCYYCALRRTETLKLKIENINLEKGLILLEGTQTKNRNLASITMPQHFAEYLKEIRIHKYLAYYFVFGKDLKPGVKAVGINTITSRHRSIVRKLKKFGLLHDIEGKTFYSWKDTAARDMIEEAVTAPAWFQDIVWMILILLKSIMIERKRLRLYLKEPLSIA